AGGVSAGSVIGSEIEAGGRKVEQEQSQGIAQTSNGVPGDAVTLDTVAVHETNYEAAATTYDAYLTTPVMATACSVMAADGGQS
ncbi:MAG: hypothetical protein WD645_01105, partial [Dehalococcoidia bacterium]